jgi:glutamate dehydrogenase
MMQRPATEPTVVSTPVTAREPTLVSGTPPGSDEMEDAELDEPLPNAEGLIAQAVALAGDNLDDAQLVGRYWRFAPDEELAGHAPEELLEAARRHRELAAQRVTGELTLRIGFRDRGRADRTTPEDQRHTVVEIVTDDMPFLVDSVAAALEARNLDIHLLVHPIVVVHRQPLGKLIEVCADVEPDDALSGDQLESWIRIEAVAIREQAERDELRNELQRVLTDVRDAVEDSPTNWPPRGRRPPVGNRGGRPRRSACRCRRRT